MTNEKLNFTFMKELDLLKKDWQKNSAFEQVSEVDIYKMLHKKSKLTYCDVRERYEHFRSRCTDEKPKVFKFKRSSTQKKKEKGCTEPLYGKKSRCVINIVPQEDKSATFKMDKKCIKTRDWAAHEKI